MKTWLLGSGWWTLWHIGLLALLLPAWTIATFVHAMVYVSSLPGGWTRFLKGAFVWAIAWWTVGWGLYRLSNLAASNTAGLAARRAGLFGFVGLVLALYAVNFTILARARGR